LVEWERIRARELENTPFYSDRTKRPRPALADTVWFVNAGDPEIMASPATAELHFWVDVLPEDDRDEVLQRFERHVLDWCASDPFLAKNPPKLERAIMRPFDGVSVRVDHPIVTTVVEAFLSATGRPTEVGGMDAATDS